MAVESACVAFIVKATQSGPSAPASAASCILVSNRQRSASSEAL